MARTKQQNELIVLAALVVVAATVWFFYGRETRRGNGTAGSGTYAPINAQDYGSLIHSLAKTQNTEYKPSGRNIFVSAPIPVEVAKAVPQKPPFVVYRNPSLPPPPPPADLPMKFFGYGALPSGGPRQAFLQDASGDDVHIVSEGEVVLNHIRIVHIGNDKIDFEDINTGQKGSKNIEAVPGPAA